MRKIPKAQHYYMVSLATGFGRRASDGGANLQQKEKQQQPCEGGWSHPSSREQLTTVSRVSNCCMYRARKCNPTRKGETWKPSIAFFWLFYYLRLDRTHVFDPTQFPALLSLATQSRGTCLGFGILFAPARLEVTRANE